ncbi:class I SAM-dependent methyltransferase [Pseudonocardia endophytica]|uniref:Ubiquinone/menaquinone biosynthesis C-methylase UbiE n=1 Tax=Pseudonocardia endophytica TaxID=401976 RepID=A0A4R1HGA3_PSEEN|nr:class I SAM-dependent methyltransferase [Pseudonocardia endophytica]TCK21177.1 ubiquinone/menaquinone biosynthesis C-methylase UbiE [Pseudonocardia endophytica]
MSRANEKQIQSWDGPGGGFWAAHAGHFDRGVAAYQSDLEDATGAGPGDRVLDVGSGNGTTAIGLAGRGAGVLGIDVSRSMLAVARERAAVAGLPGVELLCADAQTHPFEPGSFDVVVSRHGVMFFDDPAAAFTNLARALRPDGRLALLVWQPLERQEWLVAFMGALRATPPGPDGPSPVSFGDPENVRRLLDSTGFVDVDVSGLDRPMWYGDDVGDATAFVEGHFSWALEALGPGERATARDALRTVMAEHETPDGVLFRSACWLVTARKGPRR